MMKCMYAIPQAALSETKELCEKYSTALMDLSLEIGLLADELLGFVEENATSVIKLPEADWIEVERLLQDGTKSIQSGELFWSTQDVRHIGELLIKAVKIQAIQVTAASSSSCFARIKGLFKAKDGDVQAELMTTVDSMDASLQMVAAWLLTNAVRNQAVVLLWS